MARVASEIRAQAALQREPRRILRRVNRAIAEASDDGTVLTRAMSGRLARGIPNRAVRAIEHGGSIAPFPAQNWATGAFRAEAGRRDGGELLSLWAGQAAPLARHTDAGELFAELAVGLG
jgi:nitronate monooxygenase